tara:strand:- start:54 stop:737 length:684 start_codon:yes stop_codon:yes gene_type:complete
MENFLYFRKFRPATFSHTATAGTQNFTITGVGGDDIDDITEIASATVTAADAANSNIGSAYTAISGIGQVTSLTMPGALDNTAVNNSVVTVALMNGGGGTEDTANGYNLETGDIVTVTLQQGLETSLAYPVSRLKGINQGSANTETVLHFAALKNTAADDTITLTHTAGKFEDIAKAINDAANGYAKEGKLISVIDGGEGRTGGAAVMHELKDAGITSMVFSLESGY